MFKLRFERFLRRQLFRLRTLGTETGGLFFFSAVQLARRPPAPASQPALPAGHPRQRQRQGTAAAAFRSKRRKKSILGGKRGPSSLCDQFEFFISISSGGKKCNNWSLSSFFFFHQLGQLQLLSQAVKTHLKRDHDSK